MAACLGREGGQCRDLAVRATWTSPRTVGRVPASRPLKPWRSHYRLHPKAVRHFIRERSEVAHPFRWTPQAFEKSLAEVEALLPADTALPEAA